MSKLTFRLVHPSARERAAQAVKSAPDGYVVTIQEETRSSAQNRRLWASLTDISNQIEWYGRKLSAESWKHIFSSALKKQDVVPGIDGQSFVVLGVSTSKMTKKEMSDLMELVAAFGSERGVKWTDLTYEE